MSYLDDFNNLLRARWMGSLVKVAAVAGVEPNAKEYLHNAAGAGMVERVAWGWYWVPDEVDGFFDFLARDPATYLPVLSSSVITGGNKFLKLGPFRIPTKKGGIRFLRKSKSFWKILGDHGIFSSVLRKGA